MSRRIAKPIKGEIIRKVQAGERVVDLTLIWYWSGEPYTSMGVGEYRFAMQLTRGS